MSLAPDPITESTRPRRGFVILAVVVLVAAIVAAAFVYRANGEDAATDLNVTWDESEGQPGCTYDEADNVVNVKLRVTGTAAGSDEIQVTVSAYADENTSREVGSTTQSVPVEGDMDLPLELTIDVDRKPQVDVDGVAACRLSVEY